MHRVVGERPVDRTPGTPRAPGKKVVLHHVAIANATAMVNGPNLVAFDPKTHDEFLMFLTLDKDDEYVPVNGQIDPIVSIIPLHAPVTPPSNP